jgi:hypothetical protein
MKYKHLIFALMFVIFSAQIGFTARLATREDIELLKSDIISGKIKPANTRMKAIQSNYGEPQSIQDTEKKVTYDYGDLKLEFSKKYYLRDWKYDYSHKTAYSTDIKQLRKDLESGQIVGDWMELNDDIIDSYENPTEAFIKTGDGELSVYYWGEMRLTFENYFALSNIRGQNLGAKSDSVGHKSNLSTGTGVLTTTQQKVTTDSTESTTESDMIEPAITAIIK